jgi:isoleucyl-tRNA synthetase
VKRVEFATSGDALVTLEARANFRALGKKFGKQTPLAAQAVAALGSDALRRFEAGEALYVTVEGETRALDADDVTIVRRASGALVVSEEGGYFAAIDPALTPALRREGLARELVSRVQRLRKETGLQVSDRIRLWAAGDVEVEAAVAEHRDWIAGEVLATRVFVGEAERGMLSDNNAAHDVDLDGLAVRVALTKDR